MPFGAPLGHENRRGAKQGLPRRGNDVAPLCRQLALPIVPRVARPFRGERFEDRQTPQGFADTSKQETIVPPKGTIRILRWSISLFCLKGSSICEILYPRGSSIHCLSLPPLRLSPLQGPFGLLCPPEGAKGSEERVVIISFANKKQCQGTIGKAN